MTHGHIYNIDTIPALGRGDVLIYGHTHVPMAEKRGDIFIINPGSVSMPKEDSTISYGILEEDRFKIKDFDGKLIKEIAFD